MTLQDITNEYKPSGSVKKRLAKMLLQNSKHKISGAAGSIIPFYAAMLKKEKSQFQLIIMQDREEAAYLYNDLTTIIKSEDIFMLPSSYRRNFNDDNKDVDSVFARTEVLSKIHNQEISVLISFPEALAELVVSKDVLRENTIKVSKGSNFQMQKLVEDLSDKGFRRTDFVYEPGEFAVRGSIIDAFSYSEELPIRIDFFGNEIDSIRFFNPETQISEKTIINANIVPDVSEVNNSETTKDILSYIDIPATIWLKDGMSLYDKLDKICKEAPNKFCTKDRMMDYISNSTVMEWGSDVFFRGSDINLNTEAQISYNKNFDILGESLQNYQSKEYKIYICSTNEKQYQRLADIFIDKGYDIKMNYVNETIHEGFIDHNTKICVLTEHQIFDRYHKYRLKSSRMSKTRENISIQELSQLHPGDYVVHVDHGIGRFGGLVKVNNGGNEQESIRLVYKNNSELYVGLHSLHKISKYRSKDGEPPTVNKLGGEAWNRLKQKAKSKVKDIAKELISLYAKRKSEKAFAFSPDTYLQEEMEASFIYDETADQIGAINAVKKDMEANNVMDRLVCGDVGFGKTEVAIRAAFKAVADSKQVAVLVPTTILAFQHYNTFLSRLKDMPCRVEYISRMRKPAAIKSILKDLQEGRIDILIGTHRVTAKDIHFKDLGLLIIDEEQKFGVSVKEKLKHLKLNVDTITMTATPIPRTLQFSLMGARDMSIIRTPPLNRYPIVTELHRFNNDIIREAISFEISRGGQVFFINNRIDALKDLAVLIKSLLPKINVCIVHGQMQGSEMEGIMYDFIRGDYDVLLATTIIESGLDIPNANTIIINNAQNYGLSDLHQLRGRVGRSNKKAYCYLLAPSQELINSDAKRRLKAIEDFSGLGSGFNIAMQDLDIRGAGNILGAEQSGFVSEIGYETYQKILNEALLELKEEGYEGGIDIKNIQSSDCNIDTDFDALIPEAYVYNIAERIKLYREFDNIQQSSQLEKIKNELTDRFGKIPKQLMNLFKIIEVKILLKELHIEKLIVKSSIMMMYPPSNSSSSYYSSNEFRLLLSYIGTLGDRCKLVEKNNKLYIKFFNIGKVHEMYDVVNNIYSFVFNKPI